MKSLLATMLLLCVSFSYTYAGEEEKWSEDKTSLKMEEREVIPYNFSLKVSQENGVATASWDDFPANRGFEWYKLVYSTTKENPVYPNDTVVFVGERLQLKNSFKLDAWKNNHYVRLCAVVLNDDYSKDRYCSETQKLVTSTEDFVRKEEKKEYVTYKESQENKVSIEKDQKVCTKEYVPVCGKKEGVYKIYSNNCVRESQGAIKVENKLCNADKTEIKETKKESTFALSLALRERINELLTDFLEKLEDKGYSDAEIADAIDVVSQRSETLSKQAKYKNIAGYMMQELQSMKDAYSDPLGEFQWIFDGF